MGFIWARPAFWGLEVIGGEERSAEDEASAGLYQTDLEELPEELLIDVLELDQASEEHVPVLRGGRACSAPGG